MHASMLYLDDPPYCGSICLLLGPHFFWCFYFCQHTHRTRH